MENVILIAVAVLILLGSAAGFLVYLIRRKHTGEPLGQAFADSKCFAEYVLSLTALLAALLLFGKGFVGGSKTYIRVLIDGLVMMWLMVAGYIDLKEGIIPNPLIGAGLSAWALVMLLDVFVAGTSWKIALAYSLSGGLVIGGMMFIIALVVKNALGMGDVKMFLVLGLFYGLHDTYSILLISIIIMAVVSLVLLALKKVTAKTAVPMAPFVVAGFLLSILAGI